MSHEIETHRTQAAAVFARKDAWHRLGTTVRDRAFTAEEAMTLGHLGGWDVRKLPLTTAEEKQLITPAGGLSQSRQASPSSIFGRSTGPASVSVSPLKPFSSKNRTQQPSASRFPCAWAFGHEGQGVGAEIEARSRLAVRIVQPGGEESLNVASAAAICLHASASAAYGL
mgnify:CR=1 FL=1